MKADFEITNHGSIFLFTPLTERATVHLHDNVGNDAIWWAGSLAVEHRYAENLADALAAEGFELS